MPLKPLGLPPGSVRALLLLALGARAVLDLREGAEIAPWLAATLLLCGAAYFGLRHASRHAPGPAVPGAPRPRPPLGLPAGTVRFFFLALVGYGAYLWIGRHGATAANAPIGWVVAGFVVGIVVRLLFARSREAEDPSTPAFWHAQALVVLAAAGGLVAFSVSQPAGLPDWVEPFLAACVTYYFGSR
jgi:MprA protease rhombosortase-interaction domain-containing protein